MMLSAEHMSNYQNRLHPLTHTNTHNLTAALTHLESLVDVVHQGEQLDEVIHSDGDDGGAEGGGGQGDEATLPLQGEDGEQRAGAQEDAQRDPHCLRVVELLHDLRRDCIPVISD